MLGNSIFGNTMSMANKSLDYLWKKMEVVQNNLANVDTPGYKKKDVSFEEVFDKRLRGRLLCIHPLRFFRKSG